MLLECNVGMLDRMARVLIGLGLIYSALYVSMSATMVWTLAIVGCVVIVTGVSSFCPIYKVIKIKSC